MRSSLTKFTFWFMMAMWRGVQPFTFLQSIWAYWSELRRGVLSRRLMASMALEWETALATFGPTPVIWHLRDMMHLELPPGSPPWHVGRV